MNQSSYFFQAFFTLFWHLFGIIFFISLMMLAPSLQCSILQRYSFWVSFPSHDFCCQSPMLNEKNLLVFYFSSVCFTFLWINHFFYHFLLFLSIISHLLLHFSYHVLCFHSYFCSFSKNEGLLVSRLLNSNYQFSIVCLASIFHFFHFGYYFFYAFSNQYLCFPWNSLSY